MEHATPSYLACEQRLTYALLMVSAGMMGAYTYTLRGGVFCNAQTANIVMMAIAFGQKNWLHGCYYLIPVSAYLMGSFLSELLPSPVKRLGFLRWDTYLIAFETAVLFLIGWIPLTVPHQIVQVLVNFIASMQYNTFRQAEGIPMATTFCTNHVRQVGVAAAKVLRKKDSAAAARGLLHAGMLACFLLGGTVLTAFCNTLGAKTIWVALIPMLTLLFRLVHADLTTEHDLLSRKPSGH
ncbi:MAG: DUF1275 domain-containing protein [Clostridiaceae bacterium]|nr:DUF1275 domain-containing protein [Clostridiaceae bacterium]